MALLIKVQANIRGYITRKNIKSKNYNRGMGGHQLDDDGEVIQKNYDNRAVKISALDSKSLSMCRKSKTR